MKSLFKSKKEDNINETEEAFDRPVFSPETDIYDDGENIYVIANVPGVAENEIDVSLDNKVLSFTAPQQDTVMEGYERIGREEYKGVFKRSFKIDSDIDFDKIIAQTKNGVLQITLPKAEALKPRMIQVKAG